MSRTSKLDAKAVSEGFKKLNAWFDNEFEWGSRGYLVHRLARELGITRREATALHESWCLAKCIESRPLDPLSTH